MYPGELIRFIVAVILEQQFLNAPAAKAIRIPLYAKRFADKPAAFECTKSSEPCRCTEVYPREIVIECNKANLKEVDEAVASVSASKMQVLAVDVYSLVVTSGRYEFGDDFFARHQAVPRALVIQDCKIKKSAKQPTTVLLSFSANAFRTLEDTMVTLKVDCPLHSRSVDAVRKLRALNVLQLNQMASRVLEPLHFDHLIHLDLRHNEISEIKDGAFDSLPQLETLHLNANQLKLLKTGWFNGAQNLKEIVISHNEIVEVDGPFERLPQLEHLDISNNELTKIKPNLFASLTKLKLLKLESNRLTEIRPDDFYGLENLEVLSLHNNDIRTVHNDSMKSLINLKSLFLSRTCRGDAAAAKSGTGRDADAGTAAAAALVLKEHAFAGLKRLRMLDLDCAVLVTLQPDLFRHTPELRYLILANAELLQPLLTNETFAYLSGLTHIYLAGFDLDLLGDESIFSPLVSLKELNLVTYTPALFQCRKTVPDWFENFVRSNRNFTVALPNCLPKAFQ